MSKPICDKCKKEFELFGGLAFSPLISSSSLVHKYHLCKICWRKFMDWLEEDKDYE